MNFGIIYIATCKNSKKSYIGKTTQGLNIRRCRHKSDSKKLNTKFYYAIRKYGYRNFEWHILYDKVPIEMLSVAEMCAIYTYDTHRRGYNSTTGGEATLGYKHTKESKKKMSNAKIGKKCKPFTEEHRRRISESKMGNKHLDDTKRKISISQMGIRSGSKLSKETKEKIKRAHKGKSLSKEHKAKISNSCSKNKYKITKPNGTTEIIKNLEKYCKENNLTSSNMYAILSGRQKSHKNYKRKKIK